MTDARAALTALAAELHRAKWQFDLSEDYTPSRSAARALISKAFDELHRIGDLAMKFRDAANGDVGNSLTPASAVSEDRNGSR